VEGPPARNHGKEEVASTVPKGEEIRWPRKRKGKGRRNSLGPRGFSGRTLYSGTNEMDGEQAGDVFRENWRESTSIEGTGMTCPSATASSAEACRKNRQQRQKKKRRKTRGTKTQDVTPSCQQTLREGTPRLKRKHLYTEKHEVTLPKLPNASKGDGGAYRATKRRRDGCRGYHQVWTKVTNSREAEVRSGFLRGEAIDFITRPKGVSSWKQPRRGECGPQTRKNQSNPGEVCRWYNRGERRFAKTGGETDGFRSIKK